MNRFRVLNHAEARKLNLLDDYQYDNCESYLVDFKDESAPVLIASDQMEPEDANFWRDLAWVPKLLNELNIRIIQKEFEKNA